MLKIPPLTYFMSPEKAKHPLTDRVTEQLEGLSDQLVEDTATVIRFRAGDDAQPAIGEINRLVEDAMTVALAQEPKDPRQTGNDADTTSPSTVSIQQGPRHPDRLNYTPDPEHPEQFAPGEFFEIWQRFKGVLRNPTIVLVDRRAVVILRVRQGDLNRFVTLAESGIEDELLTDLGDHGINLQKPVRLQTVIRALNDSGKFRKQLETEPGLALAVRIDVY